MVFVCGLLVGLLLDEFTAFNSSPTLSLIAVLLTPLWMLGFLLYVVVCNSKKRWPLTQVLVPSSRGCDTHAAVIDSRIVRDHDHRPLDNAATEPLLWLARRKQ